MITTAPPLFGSLTCGISAASHTAHQHLIAARLVRSRGGAAFLRPLLAFTLLLLACPCALATQYIYDNVGRLVAVVPPNGSNITQYSYDASGNVLSIHSIPPSQLAVFTVGPQQGTPGSQITIYGSGFSTTLANDTVSFNGATATVVSATATELVVDVPSGASSGPVSVTVNNTTVSSTQNFASIAAPSITSITPTLVDQGATVTVTGSGFNLAPAETSLILGTGTGAITSDANATIQFTVSASLSPCSGPVSVSTPYGDATSAQELLIMPPGAPAAEVVSTGRLVPGGQAATVNVDSTSHYGMLNFDATQGQYLTIQVNKVSTPDSSPVNYTVYSPLQKTFATGQLNAGAQSLHLPITLVSGAYLVLLQPTGSSASVQAALQADPIVTADGSPLDISVTVPGQDIRFIYSGSAGDSLALGLTSISNLAGPNAGDAIWTTITAPSGASYPTPIGSFSSNIDVCLLPAQDGCSIGLPFHPTSGTYLIEVSDAQSFAFSATASLSSDLAKTLSVGSPQTVTTAEPGQEELLHFSASAGQTFALYLAPATLSPADTSLNASVYSPTGVLLNTLYYMPNLPLTFDLPNLTAGTYSVLVWPSSNQGNGLYTAPQGSIQATLAPGVTNSLATNGTQTNISTTVPGQLTHLTFQGTPGESIAVALTNVSISDPLIGQFDGAIYAPDGSVVPSYFYCYTDYTTCEGNVPNLPQSGTYTIVLEQAQPSDATMSMTVSATQDATGTLTIGTAVNMNLTEMGQNGAFKFTVPVKESLTLHLNNPTIIQTTDASGLMATVYDSSGNTVATIPATSASYSVRMTGLHAGTYLVIVSPDFPATASGQLKVATN